jgi:hypothetical protein
VVYGKPMTPRDVIVRAHERQVDIAPRNYLDEPFDEMAEEIAETYADVIGAALAQRDDA